MIIVNVTSGLGNQLFQYSIGRRLSLKYEVPLRFSTYFYEQHSHRTPTLLKHRIAGKRVSDAELSATLQYPKVSKWMQEGKEILPTPSGGLKANLYYLPRFFPEFTANTFHYFREKLENDYFTIRDWPYRRRFHPKILECGENAYLHGFWQSAKYFQDIDDVIKEDLTISEDLPESNRRYKSITDQNTAVSIHIRRGDKLESEAGTLPIKYYRHAIDYIENEVEDPFFLIFSDDIPWAKNNLDVTQKCEFVTENGEKTDYLDLHLMKNCDHNIIADSTFSWWGAFLNDYENKIVTVPDPWPDTKWPNDSIHDTDLIPTSWEFIKYQNPA